MSVCVQYSRPASGQNEGEVFGLDVAVNNFLSAYFRYGTSKTFLCRPTDMPSFEHFQSLAVAAGHAPASCVGLDPRHPALNLGAVSCMFRPDPLTAELIWKRQQVQGRGYATCGLVHTMSGDRIARAVGELCVAPSDASDVLICPSDAIRQAVQSLWTIHTDYYNHRFNARFSCPVETRVIPLGVATEKFAARTTPEKRAAQRAALAAGDQDIVILFHGRLSFASKAHPLALFQATQLAARTTKKKLRLVMYGYFKPQDMEKHYRDLAADFPDTAIDFVSNDDPRFPDALWAGADIFVSLADNIQESFGLTPVEAMAAGLPAVITDWNGYRGGVRDGQDGFLVPTMTPPPNTGMAIAETYYNFENYGFSLMGAAQSTIVDVKSCAAAFVILADNNEKRRAFGASGRQRAREVYDWKQIIPQYEMLWGEQAEKRAAMKLAPPVPLGWQAVNPNYPNPWKMFESFPSRHLADSERMRIALDNAGIDRIMRHEMNFFLPDLILPHLMMMQLIDSIRKAEAPFIRDILSPFPAGQHDRLWRCLGWMLKHGIAELYVPPSSL